MFLHPTLDTGVPPETAAVAQAAFPRGHAYLSLRDALGPIHADAQFAGLFARDGQPAACPWRLTLFTLLQFAENLSDRHVADAVRGRIDWKYLLGLALTDFGFDASVLSGFRSRFVAGAAEALLFDTRLDLCCERGLLAERGRQGTDATHVFEAVRGVSSVDGRLALPGSSLGWPGPVLAWLGARIRWPCGSASRSRVAQRSSWACSGVKRPVAPSSHWFHHG